MQYSAVFGLLQASRDAVKFTGLEDHVSTETMHAKNGETPVSFATHPDRYRHWKLAVDGAVARLIMAVDEKHALREGYDLKLNSYDLAVDIDLGSLDAARTVLEGVALLSLAESLGGVESLISHPATMTHASVPAEQRRARGITDGERVAVNDTGNAGMATAGSGDVLSGILVAYLARMAAPGGTGAAVDKHAAFECARRAVRTHGCAGDLAAARLGERAVVASDLIDELPEAQREMEER